MSETTLVLSPFDYGDRKIDPSQFPAPVLSELIRRAILHVLGPESASKIVATNKKRVKDNLPELEGDARDAELESIRTAYLDAMVDGSWGAGARTPRGPAPDREKAIFDKIVLDAVKATLAPHVKSGQIVETTLEGEIAWVQNGTVVPLSEWTRRYFANTEKGEERMRIHQTQASEKYAAERRAAELKAEAAKAIASGGLGTDSI